MLSEDEKQELFARVAGKVAATVGRERARAGCLYFAAEGQKALREAGIEAVVQAGSAFWPIDTEIADDGSVGGFGYEWQPVDDLRRLFLKIWQSTQRPTLPEIHVWLGIVETQEVVDFSSGQFPAQAKALRGFDWPGPRPPQFVWSTYEDLPGGVRYLPDRMATIFAGWWLDRINGLNVVSLSDV